MDWNFAALALDLIKFIGLCFWLGLTLKGVWGALRLSLNWLVSHRQLRRIGEHRAYLD